jgi:hypothetical protein
MSLKYKQKNGTHKNYKPSLFQPPAAGGLQNIFKAQNNESRKNIFVKEE